MDLDREMVLARLARAKRMRELLYKSSMGPDGTPEDDLKYRQAKVMTPGSRKGWVVGFYRFDGGVMLRVSDRNMSTVDPRFDPDHDWWVRLDQVSECS